MYCSVVIVAAGKGTRMNVDINKQYLKLNDKEVVAHTIEKFESCDFINEIIVVVGKEEVDYFNECILAKYKFSKVKAVVAGGQERQNSVYNGLMRVSENTDIVVIHDGARPLVKKEQIIDSIKEANNVGACVIGVPVKDTIKTCNSENFVTDTPERDKLWIVQTPQTFRYKWIMDAHEKFNQSNLKITDDAMLIEMMDYPLKMVKGSYDNIKITTPEDLIIAEMMLKQL